MTLVIASGPGRVIVVPVVSVRCTPVPSPGVRTLGSAIPVDGSAEGKPRAFLQNPPFLECVQL